MLFELLLRFGCASVSIISLYLTSINRLFINTYKHGLGTHNPLVEGPIPSGPSLRYISRIYVYNSYPGSRIISPGIIEEDAILSYNCEV
jgi:hypothetical protein